MRSGKSSQKKSRSGQGARKRATRRRQAAKTPEEKSTVREVSVDLGPIEPGVEDVLALIDQERRRRPVERELEPKDERGPGGAAERRGRGGRAGKRTPEQPGLRGKTKNP